MKFLAVMLLLLLGRYRSRPAWAERVADAGHPGTRLHWMMLAIYVVILESLLLMFYSWEIGFLVLVVELMVLYIYLPHWAPCDLTGEYYHDWCRGDYQAAWLDLVGLLGLVGEAHVEDNREAHYAVCRQYIYKAGIGFFALLFWYVWLGIPGIYLALWSGWMAASARNGRTNALARVIVWLPIRALAFTFFVVGNGLSAYEQLKNPEHREIADPEWLLRIALAAVGDESYRQFRHGKGLSEEEFRHHGAEDITRLHILVRRSAILWFVVFGVFTMLGIESPLF